MKIPLLNPKIFLPIIIIVLIFTIVVGFIYLKKQWFDDGSVFTTSTISSDKVSRLSASGGDLRIYEFTPRTAPNMQCLFVAGNSKGSVFCFRKEEYVETN